MKVSDERPSFDGNQGGTAIVLIVPEAETGFGGFSFSEAKERKDNETDRHLRPHALP